MFWPSRMPLQLVLLFCCVGSAEKVLHWYWERKMPRFAAMIFTCLLIGLVAFVVLGGIGLIGPALAHGETVEHDSGIIVNTSRNMDFVLTTSTGMSEHFACGGHCRTEFSHIQR